MADFLGPGVHRIDPARYHADPCERPSLSSTLARLLIDRSPLHAWTASPRLNPDWAPRITKEFDLGRAIHRAVLGNGEEFCVYPVVALSSDGRASTKAAKEFEAECRDAGRTPLKPDEFDMVMAAQRSVRRKLRAMGIVIDPAHSEVTAIAEIDRVMCRAMLDYVPPGQPWALDLKSTTDASPDACIRAVTSWGYDVQGEHYAQAWEAATGERRRIRYVFVEKTPPFEVSVVELFSQPGHEADWGENAANKVWYARRLWRDCLETGIWPGYPAQVAIVGAPGFYRAKWDAFGVQSEAPPAKPSPDTLRTAYAAQAPERTA